MGTSHSNCVAAILRSWYLYDHIEQYVYQFGLSPISLGAARVVLSGFGNVSLNLPGPPVFTWAPKTDMSPLLFFLSALEAPWQRLCVWFSGRCYHHQLVGVMLGRPTWPLILGLLPWPLRHLPPLCSVIVVLHNRSTQHGDLACHAFSSIHLFNIHDSWTFLCWRIICCFVTHEAILLKWFELDISIKGSQDTELLTFCMA